MMRRFRERLRNRPLRWAASGIVVGSLALLVWGWYDLFEKRVAVVVPGRLVRGAWQRPGPLRRLIDREKIRTIVTLTAINQDDPKYIDQAKVVRETGVRWIIVPMRGSRATLEQMAEAADLLADTRLQPVFFHCVAGHHRTSQTHAAYRIRHENRDAPHAWAEVSAFSWARPSADSRDRQLIDSFAASAYAHNLNEKDADDDARTVAEVGPPTLEPDPRPDRNRDRLESRDGELRRRR